MKNLVEKFLLRAFMFLLLSFLILPSANALSFKAGESLVLNEQFLDDTYIVAGNGTIDGDILGDLYLAGGQVVINGNVLEDLVVAGGKVTVTGSVGGDVRVVGGQIAIYGNVGDDIVIGGGQVDVGKNAVVNGSLVAGAGVLTIDGEIKEDVRGLLGMLFLNGAVRKDVIVTVEDTLNIAKSAAIDGNLNYSAILEAKVPDGVVKGTVSFNKFEKESFLEDLTFLFFVQKLFSFLAATLLLLVFVILTPKSLVQVGNITRAGIIKSFGVGLITMIAAFIGSLLLLITIIGIPLGLIILAILFIIFYISKIFVAAWLGSYIVNYKKAVSRGKLFAGIVTALFLYYVVSAIPFVGWLINLLFFLIGVGSMTLLKMQYWKFLKEKKMV